MSNPQTELFKDDAGEHRFRVKGGNGEIIVQSEGYSTKFGAFRGLVALRRALRLADPIKVDHSGDER